MTEEEKLRLRRRLAVCYSLLVTPFEEDGRVDWFSFERLLEQQKEAGVGGVGVCFQMGEGGALREREYSGLVAMAACCLGGRTPVAACCGASSTDRAVRLAQIACKAGADLLYCPPPAGSTSFAPGYFHHLSAIAGAVPLPLISLRSPGKSGLRLSLEQAGINGLLGVGETGEDLLESQLLKREAPLDTLLFSTRDSRLFLFGCLGFDGAFSSLSCLYPRAVNGLFEGVRRGQIEKARQLQFSLLPLVSQTEGEEGAALVKWALHRRGLCTPALRLPMALPCRRTLDAFEKACLQFEKDCRLC